MLYCTERTAGVVPSQCGLVTTGFTPPVAALMSNVFTLILKHPVHVILIFFAFLLMFGLFCG